ncbi:uncharacterized protein CTRU02_210745 [Colletotrichum truncatum]|uniref:Uncharacterized protein n=1 Tax=Colletotrichum truncatum TaxID=5467 RepID=A0ACC3YPU3_COLTU|nr:uncharacterized protein CTRU02_03768 [Colletotrichum truncatum]KAF6796790.1 hypothetical protein CTRU02_03768 [Colletotrichum truncatum]
MCYKVHTHRMICDIRPTISSTQTDYLNPYETPPICPCSIPIAHSCPSHGCCSLSSTLYRCARQCRKPMHYHKYINASKSRRQSPTWRRIRVFDRNPDFRTVESAEFRFAVSELLDIGRIILHAERELVKGRLRVEREQRRHERAHGACARVLNDWECAWRRRIRRIKAEVDNLKLCTEVLGECWVKYVGLLRRYERLGQRRVSGIVEDRERRRHRSGDVGQNQESRPWRNVRRESWDAGQERRDSREMNGSEERRGGRQDVEGAERRRSWWRIV